MKCEELHRAIYRSETNFRNAVDKYIIFLNTKRSHKKLQYQTPRGKRSTHQNKRILKVLTTRLKVADFNSVFILHSFCAFTFFT
ncbi:hypothetical protein [Ruminococcus sp.]|uniref:hypothetical protein n=1 Tax=Ruminococcus sp. TaxID=41978 RepID=UPI003AAB7D5E